MGTMSERVSAISDTSREFVSVPEWGGLRFEVRSLSLAERNRIALATRNKKGDTDINRYYAALCIAACYDPDAGEDVKAFSASDMDMLQTKNGAATDRLAKVAMKLSGLSNDEDKDEDDEDSESSLERAIDDAGKGSSSTES